MLGRVAQESQDSGLPVIFVLEVGWGRAREGAGSGTRRVESGGKRGTEEIGASWVGAGVIVMGMVEEEEG